MTESSFLSDPAAVQHQPASVDKSRGSFTDHLANERTFLAWTRTGLGVFALGCALARFGGTNDVKSASTSTLDENKPLISGLILNCFGIVTVLYGIYRYYQTNRHISQKDLTTVSQIREPVIMTFMLLISMVVIAVILII